MQNDGAVLIPRLRLLFQRELAVIPSEWAKIEYSSLGSTRRCVDTSVQCMAWRA